MIRKALPAALLLLLPALVQAEAKLLRYPSYSKGKVAFSYLGSSGSPTKTARAPSALPTIKLATFIPAFPRTETGSPFPRIAPAITTFL